MSLNGLHIRRLRMVMATSICAFFLHGGAALAQNFGDCEVPAATPGLALATKEPGIVSIAGPFQLSPQGYVGDTLDTIHGGDLYCITAEIAARTGNKGISIRSVPWDAVVTAKDSNFDLSVMNTVITDERRKVVDFSDPFRTIYPVAIARANREIKPEDLKNMVVGIQTGAPKYLDFLTKEFSPKEIRQIPSTDDLYQALNSGLIDVVVNDYTSALPAVQRSNGRLKALARFPLTVDIGILFPKGSPNVAVVNKVLADMKADGSMQKIVDKWVFPILGVDPDTLPLWDGK